MPPRKISKPKKKPRKLGGPSKDIVLRRGKPYDMKTKKPVKALAPSYDYRRDGVTQSLIAKFVHCRVAADFYLQNWRSIRPKRSYQYGSLFHRLLEGWYGGARDSHMCPEKFFDKIEEEWLVYSTRIGDDIKEVEKDLAMAYPVFRGYVQYWKKADDKLSWVEVEGVFDQQFQLTRLRGRCDGVFHPARGGVHWLLETKTKSQISESLSSQLSFDFQNLFYLVAKRKQTGLDIRGVLYNVIRKPQLKMGDGESSKEYSDRIWEDMKKRPDFYYKRFEVIYSAKQIRDAEAELTQKLCEFENWRLGLLKTYKNQSACLGRWTCDYLGACARGDISKANYHQKGILFEELFDE